MTRSVGLALAALAVVIGIALHAWQFTSASFELILRELARLGKTDWLVDRITPAMGCEFHVWLRRGGITAAAALTAEELNARRLELLTRTLRQAKEQVDFLPGGHKS